MKFVLTRREALQAVGAMAASPIWERYSSLLAYAEAPSRSPRDRSFDEDWRFHHGDATGAEMPGFDDASWRKLDLPHDWSIEDLPPTPASNGENSLADECLCPSEIGPFSRTRSEGRASVGWFVGGIAWYRKTFDSPVHAANGRSELRFDGVFMNADVWINGHLLGNHPYGYTGFAFDITQYLREDGKNVVAVKVNNTGKTSRWYTGSGIYRHTWLTVTPNVHVPLWGIHIIPSKITKDSALISARISVTNLGGKASRARVETKIIEPGGSVVLRMSGQQTIRVSDTAEFQIEGTLQSPRLWSPAAPNLYRADVEVYSDNGAVDTYSTTFGIRSIEVDAQRGLRINGESFKLRGGCVHHDNGVLGSVAIDRAEERRVEILKANGFNAIRCSHNPPSPAFLDACDRLGMMVIDEAFDTWEKGKESDDYHRFFKDWWQRDIDTMLLRDRNHPSVILWSIGNEIPERIKPEGLGIERELIERVRSRDTTRPITEAVPAFFDQKPRPWSDTDAAFQMLDVGGYNYEWSQYASDHQRHPERVMVGTESYPAEVAEIWQIVNSSDYVIGDFVWTAIDYFGESALGATLIAPPGKPSGPSAEMMNKIGLPVPAGSTTARPGFPWFNSYCGDIDIIGNKKPISFYRDVVWGRSKLEMAVQRPLPKGREAQITAWGWWDDLPSWTWPNHEGESLTVRVYSSGDRVQLLLNGKQISEAEVSTETKLMAVFNVEYQPGELKAIALRDGKPIAQAVLQTTGGPTRLALFPDRTEISRTRNDLSFVRIHIEDDKGQLVVDASNEIQVKVSGGGELAGIGSSNPKRMHSFQSSECQVFHGKCLAVVRPTGGVNPITVEVTGKGLKSATTQIHLRELKS